MFRRYPYWGWLIICIALWCVTIYDFSIHRQALLPDRMASEANSDLKRRAEACDALLKDKEALRGIFSDSVSQKESMWLNNMPFYLFAYRNDSLILWNTNVASAPAPDSLGEVPTLVTNEKGVFLGRFVYPFYGDTIRKMAVLFPVVISYPIENEYLKSHFVASSYIPAGTSIVAPAAAVAGDYPVIYHGKNVFYLHFRQQDIGKWTPDTTFLVILILALLATMSWLQLMIIYHTSTKSTLVGFVINAEVIFILRWLLYTYGYPFNLDTLAFFSPELYASNVYLSSLGDLCLNTFCVMWFVMFIIRHTPYKTYFSGVRKGPVAHAVAALLILALIAYVFLFVNVIHSLVRDSNISFDVGHFYSINSFTIVGIFVIGAIAGLSCLIIYIFNIQLNCLIRNKTTKYLLILAVSILFVILANDFREVFYWMLAGWLLLFIILSDVPRLALTSDLFEPHMIFWAVFVCLFCTSMLEYFITEKEHIARVAFAQQKFTPEREYFLESAFDKTIRKIENDDQLKHFLTNPSATARRLEDKAFDSLYLTGPVARYDLKVYFFDAGKRPLFNRDNYSFEQFENEKNESSSTNSHHLFYNESILDRQYYLAFIPVHMDTGAGLAGYAIINMDQKKQASGTVYPELLQPATNSSQAENNEYAYATYVNGKLIKQTSDNYPFPTYLRSGNDSRQFDFVRKDNINELHYNIGEKRTIIVVHLESQIIATVTLFSYIFGMQLGLALLILVYQMYLSYFSGEFSYKNFFRLTLRRRVHFSMLAVVVISFVIIGGVTTYFFATQYKQANENRLQSSMAAAKLRVQDYLRDANGFESEHQFDSVSQSPAFHGLVSSIAAGQKIDMNIFDERGALKNTSQDEIFNMGLIAPRMRPDALYQLNVTGKSVLIQKEDIAGLSYLSAYEPLRDENGVTLGYINVPFFSSEKNLNFQLSNIVVTLVNLDAFIFLISSLIAVLITRRITRTFNLIIRQFGRLNLQQNERISWPYNDEIGLLVAEYNKMVNKVEENASRLAQSERERAWREMARQVAHEIKNPLTPMKLNIQYLKQAMQNDHPNIRELTYRVADSIVEQINNLSYIASEFSNFAKMPEAKAEEIDLADLLRKATELYLNDAKIRLAIPDTGHGIYVLSDHSQLLRVFTNLLENAIQAIPAEREGRIDVTLEIRDDNAIITVKDNGTGIPPDIAASIFQPYFTTKSSGTGLGLAMTRKIIEFWKGAIWFETEEGEGACFYLSLPLLKG